MCDVLWCYTTAEGAATVWAALIALLGGLLALLGAWLIGIRQIKIQHLQTRIANGMFAIEQTRLKAELYDRRVQVYAATKAFLDTIITRGVVPGHTHEQGVTLDEDIYRQFMDASSAAQFLFDDDVVEYLQQVWTLAMSLHSAAMQQTAGERTENSELKSDAITRQWQIRDRLVELGLKLGEVFGPHMRLAPAASEPGHIDD